MEMCEVFLIIIIIVLSIVIFFVHISVCIFTFLIVCLLNLVLMIWIFFRRCSVFYGVFGSFTDRTYGNAFFLSLTWKLYP